jgi:integrase
MELSSRQQAQAANLRTHLTEGEISDLLELARKTDPRAWAIFALSFNHGLRVTEVLNLRLDGDINWKDRTVRIARLKGSMTTTQALVEMRGKPALSEVSALRAYLKVRIEDGSGKLFTGQKGPLRRWTLTRIFRSAANAMHFHSLKHSIATILASRVDNIFHVKTHLGHTAISSTMQYCHPNQKATAAKVKEILSQVFAHHSSM